MRNTDDKPRLFVYPKALLSTLHLVFWVPFLFIGAGLHALKMGYFVIGIIFLLGGVFFLTIFFNVHIQYALIRVNPTGIGAYRFGRIWNFLEWVAIQRIMKVREFDLPSSSYRDCYYLSTSRRSGNFNLQKLLANKRYGTILFDDRIVDLRSLLDVLNREAELHGIEMIYMDRAEALRTGVKAQEIKIGSL